MALSISSMQEITLQYRAEMGMKCDSTFRKLGTVYMYFDVWFEL